MCENMKFRSFAYFEFHIFKYLCIRYLDNKGRFRFKPISAFVYIFTLHQSERFKFENINKRSEKILSHSKASVSYNIYFFCLKPKGYIKTGIYLKFCRGTFCNSTQNAKYRCFNLCHDRALLR